VFQSLLFKSNNDKTNLSCKNKNDRFTVDEVNGNGSLDYPVGLMDVTEITLAYNNDSPHKAEVYFWGGSPFRFINSYASDYYANFNGNWLSNIVSDTFFVRPSVSLKAGTEYSTGDGSSTKPYVIETKKPNIYERVKLDSNNPTKYVKKYTGDTSTFTGDKDVYYYYGAASNNNVSFAGYCWKIVRTTDTGGVKLLYNGVPDASGACNNTGEASSF